MPREQSLHQALFALPRRLDAPLGEGNRFVPGIQDGSDFALFSQRRKRNNLTNNACLANVKQTVFKSMSLAFDLPGSYLQNCIEPILVGI